MLGSTPWSPNGVTLRIQVDGHNVVASAVAGRRAYSRIITRQLQERRNIYATIRIVTNLAFSH